LPMSICNPPFPSKLAKRRVPIHELHLLFLSSRWVKPPCTPSSADLRLAPGSTRRARKSHSPLRPPVHGRWRDSVGLASPSGALVSS
jgi:hypothetical protein